MPPVTLTKALSPGVRRDTAQEGETLHIVLGDDDGTNKERRRLLARGLTLIDQDGVKRWQTTEEIWPTVWHPDGNRTRHEVVLHRLFPGSIMDRTVLRGVWRSSKG